MVWTSKRTEHLFRQTYQYVSKSEDKCVQPPLPGFLFWVGDVLANRNGAVLFNQIYWLREGYHLPNYIWDGQSSMTTGDRRKFNECRLLGVKQKILGGPWLNGKHLPHVKAFTVNIVKLCIRQTKQVSELHFYFHLPSTSAAWVFQSFKIQWKLILNHSSSSNIKMVLIFWFISYFYGSPPNN